LAALDEVLLRPFVDADAAIEMARQAFAMVERHADREDRELLPRLVGPARRFAETMEGEHLYLKRHMRRVMDALAARKTVEADALYRELRDLLGRHMDAEEIELLGG